MSQLEIVRAQWDFLRILQPLFHVAKSLPTVEEVDQGDHYGLTDAPSSSGTENSTSRDAIEYPAADDIDILKDEITILRNDLKLNIIKQQQVDLDRMAAEGALDLEDLQNELILLLDELERLVDPTVNDIVDSGLFLKYTKLAALRNLLQKQDSPETRSIAESGINQSSLGSLSENNNTSDFLPLLEADIISSDTKSSWGEQYSQASVALAAAYIRFPQEASRIVSCRRTVSQFGMVLDKLLGDPVGSTTSETQISEYTPQDVAAIKYAYDFASTCTSLFEQLAKIHHCGTVHQAKLHMSGFRRDQLRLNIGTCLESGWISALFTRSVVEEFAPILRFEDICSRDSPLLKESQLVQVAFNSDSMWERLSEEVAESESIPYFPADGSKALNEFLTPQNSLQLKYRKLVGVLLASSLFQLSDSPWIEQHLGHDTIFIPLPNKQEIHLWCPQIVCSLTPRQIIKLQSEDIAAFGVLVLELEADRMASWTEEDYDWISGEKSNHVRLVRILRQWEDEVSDDYRDVAKACLQFDNLVQSLVHPDIIPDQKGIAIVYKHILEPLFHHLLKSFGKLTPLFDGMFGPWRSLTAAMNVSTSNTAKRILFDDDDSLASPGDRTTAKKFLDDLKPFFDGILNLRKRIDLTNPSGHERIRIAVLDSGLDDSTDPIIRSAIRSGQINTRKSKSFVGQPHEWQDLYGHGTHVTRLLIKTAPAAEIYVGKICVGKAINDEFMPGIAAVSSLYHESDSVPHILLYLNEQAIQWATEECKAHIISMSFGFDEKNSSIEEAIDKALADGRLIFAAASNNGGLSGRSRPARRDDVICVHATDGKGNPSGMNPTYLKKKDNFATLGIAVPSRWKRDDVWKSGTSFVTPIAAGFAADVLEFANYRCTRLDESERMLLRKKTGMDAIFGEMAEERQKYDFLYPGHLWKELRTESDVAKVIEDVIKELT
ncbi:hypothetical protein N0V90_001012 [Kalmusia sp. IMI 367209]|nr:hypothetical protein N0V90_001012 [Kalmusia sp. IMI 367209]